MNQDNAIPAGLSSSHTSRASTIRRSEVVGDRDNTTAWWDKKKSTIRMSQSQNAKSIRKPPFSTTGSILCNRISSQSLHRLPHQNTLTKNDYLKFNSTLPESICDYSYCSEDFNILNNEGVENDSENYILENIKSCHNNISIIIKLLSNSATNKPCLTSQKSNSITNLIESLYIQLQELPKLIKTSELTQDDKFNAENSATILMAHLIAEDPGKRVSLLIQRLFNINVIIEPASRKQSIPILLTSGNQMKPKLWQVFSEEIKTKSRQFSNCIVKKDYKNCFKDSNYMKKSQQILELFRSLQITYKKIKEISKDRTIYKTEYSQYPLTFASTPYHSSLVMNFIKDISSALNLAKASLKVYWKPSLRTGICGTWFPGISWPIFFTDINLLTWPMLLQHAKEKGLSLNYFASSPCRQNKHIDSDSSIIRSSKKRYNTELTKQSNKTNSNHNRINDIGYSKYTDTETHRDDDDCSLVHSTIDLIGESKKNILSDITNRSINKTAIRSQNIDTGIELSFNSKTFKNDLDEVNSSVYSITPPATESNKQNDYFLNYNLNECLRADKYQNLDFSPNNNILKSEGKILEGSSIYFDSNNNLPTKLQSKYTTIDNGWNQKNDGPEWIGLLVDIMTCIKEAIPEIRVHKTRVDTLWNYFQVYYESECSKLENASDSFSKMRFCSSSDDEQSISSFTERRVSKNIKYSQARRFSSTLTGNQDFYNSRNIIKDTKSLTNVIDILNYDYEKIVTPIITESVSWNIFNDVSSNVFAGDQLESCRRVLQTALNKKYQRSNENIAKFNYKKTNPLSNNYMSKNLSSSNNQKNEHSIYFANENNEILNMRVKIKVTKTKNYVYKIRTLKRFISKYNQYRKDKTSVNSNFSKIQIKDFKRLNQIEIIRNKLRNTKQYNVFYPINMNSYINKNILSKKRNRLVSNIIYKNKIEQNINKNRTIKKCSSRKHPFQEKIYNLEQKTNQQLNNELTHKSNSKYKNSRCISYIKNEVKKICEVQNKSYINLNSSLKIKSKSNYQLLKTLENRTRFRRYRQSGKIVKYCFVKNFKYMSNITFREKSSLLFADTSCNKKSINNCSRIFKHSLTFRLLSYPTIIKDYTNKYSNLPPVSNAEDTVSKECDIMEHALNLFLKSDSNHEKNLNELQNIVKLSKEALELEKSALDEAMTRLEKTSKMYSSQYNFTNSLINSAIASPLSTWEILLPNYLEIVK